ncbi:Peptide deformylase [Geodia barretti]|uniref:Peptide deformylase n=1 Tax=Geodia barretti TaxID=519541 RepID=A0AA35R4N3_GEOBA|nr:Peptide deformylase [Geodia barretti]
MFETMYEAEGVGLAAQQVGYTGRETVWEGSVRPADAIVVILWTEGEYIGEEGCLALPEDSENAECVTRRGIRCRVCALDGNGRVFEMDLDGIAAKALQHEIDHLNGVLILEHFNAIKRNLLRGQLRKLQREGKKQAPGMTYV